MSVAAPRLRRARPSDLDAIVSIDQQRIAPGWPRADMADVIGSDHWRLVIAEAQRAAVVGFCLSRKIVDEVELLKIAVNESFAGQGVGRMLMEDLLSSAQGSACISLEVRRSNGAALHLYRALGFELVGNRPRYYPDGEDALLMTLKL